MHQRAGDYNTHLGQNSASHHVEYMQSGLLCPFAAQHPATCRLWWVTTHQRLNHIDHGYPQVPTCLPMPLAPFKALASPVLISADGRRPDTSKAIHLKGGFG